MSTRDERWLMARGTLCEGCPSPVPDTSSGQRLFPGIVIVLLLYVLSVGPVVKLALADKIPEHAVEVIYSPLVWLCDTPLGEKMVRPGLVWYGQTLWHWELPLK